MKASLANKIWLAAQRAAYIRFKHALGEPQNAQLFKLNRYLVKNRQTTFGKKFSFSKISSYKQFANRLPLMSYENYSNYIDAIITGKKRVLTEERVLYLEETSGSSDHSKYIPFTKTFKREIDMGVSPWIFSLYRQKAAAFEGCAYWSLSPPLKPRATFESQVPIGAGNDLNYFSPFKAFLLSHIISVAPDLKDAVSSDDFYLRSLVDLLGRSDLSFISVWSPTFLLQLDRFLRKNRAQIIKLAFNRLPSSRLKEISAILATDFQWQDLWPQLAIVSCWCDAQSAFYIETLQQLLGSVQIQGKGLFATEALVSLPFEGAKMPVLAVNSHFYEFRDLQNSKIYLAHELKLDGEYEVIVTTGAGLYRYCMKDIVRVRGFLGLTPQLSFLGRGASTSDLVGEKLSEYHANEAIRKALAVIGASTYGFVYANKSGQRYCLYLNSGKATLDKKVLSQAAQSADQVLRQNHYYAQAQNLGQLGALDVILIDQSVYEQIKSSYQQKKQIKDGDLKLPALYAVGSLNDILPSVTSRLL